MLGRPDYVVHRLDKETSGALVFAKNPFVLPVLNRLLEDKKIQRDYWALILGTLPKKQLVYKDKLGRDRHDRRKRIVDPRKGLYAETHVTSLKDFQTHQFGQLPAPDRSYPTRSASTSLTMAIQSWGIRSITPKELLASCSTPTACDSPIPLP